MVGDAFCHHPDVVAKAFGEDLAVAASLSKVS